MTGAAAIAAPSFPALTGRVIDGADMLSPQTEQRLDGELANLEATTGRQLVVATVPDLQGYEIEDYGYQLGRTWGLGSKDKDDGAILLVAPKERKVRIEVGYGLEPILTDAMSSIILQTAVLPAFREGKMEQGVVAGAEAVIQQLALPADQASARAAQAAAQAQGKPSQNQGLGLPIIFIILILFWIIGGLTRGRRRGAGSAWWLLPIILSGGRGGGRGGGGGGWGGGGDGGFGGGGGSFGGGGSSGSW
nr:TPM domain-containing protein [Phenylobacterium immobile]